MAKNFTDRSKLLEEHHTELIRTDTTAQSNEIIEDDFTFIINQAKQLLREEQIDEFHDRDIFDIQNSIQKYSKELEKYNQDVEIYGSENIEVYKENSTSIQKYSTELEKFKQEDDTYESEDMEMYKENSATNLSENREVDIVEIQNSVDKYSKELELYKQDVTTRLNKSREMLKRNEIQKTRLCKTREMVKWNDDIFDSPNPKNNKAYLRQIQNENIDESDAEEKEIEALTSMILDKYEFLEKTKIPKYEISRTEIKNGSSSKGKLSITTEAEKEKIQYTINYELDNNAVKNDQKQIDDKEVKWEENYSELTEIPELKITPQKVKKVYLEVKKLSIENTETSQNFDQSPREVEKRNKQIQTYETRIKQAKNRLASNTILQWKNFVKKRQEMKKAEMDAKRADMELQKINHFVEKLETFKNEIQKRRQEQEKVKESPKLKSSTCLKQSRMNNFEYRFKAQKDIIEMQKQKLAEQNRIIEELKQNKIQKEVRNSFENAKILHKTILKKSSRKSIGKPDTKENTQSQISESNPLNLVLKLSTVPQNIKTMEERAKERQEKRMIIQERKRLLDEEKKRSVEEAMQRKMKEEQEEKQQRVEKLKRQRDLVRQMEVKKQFEKLRYIELTETAHHHYKTKLKKIGLERLKCLVYNLKIKCEIAKRFYENNIIIKCFKSWYMYSSEIIDNKNKLASDLFSKNLLSKSWSCWRSYQFQIVQMNQVAVDRYEMSLQLKYFKDWRKLTCEYRVQFITNSKKADKYYRRALLFHCLEKWRSLPAIMQIERVQNERKRKWRLRVAEILSDYDPHKNYEV